jgi:hypothetical protein
MRTKSNIIKKSFDDITNKSQLPRINSRYAYKILEVGRYRTSYYFLKITRSIMKGLKPLTNS